ncbi:MAG: peptidase [Gemmatimonadetes bacterium]|nr:peptidase [Gemmatimonadota bacterium]
MTNSNPAVVRAIRSRRKFRRTLLSARWWHKWIGVGIGLVLILWIVTGLIMLVPMSNTSRLGSGTGGAVDWSLVVVSPAQAGQAAVVAGHGHVRSIELKRFRDGMAYVVRLAPRGSVIVDAGTSSVVMIDASLAAAMASDGLGAAKVERIDRVESQGNEYRGSVPAWHVVLGDQARTEAYVAIANGEIRRSDRMDRLKATWGHSAHVFTPLDRNAGDTRASHGALWATSILALFSIVAGYWLALPRTWRRSMQ